MDAQSLHEHQESTPRQRLGLNTSAKPVVEIAGNDDIEPVKNVEESPEESMPEIEVVEVIEPVVNKEPAPEPEPAPVEDEKEPEEPEENEEDKPNPWTPDAVEERHQNYRFTSTSIPKQEHRSSIEPAKPVRDNANAVILILLIAILLVTVSIYAVILAREEKTSDGQVQTVTSDEKSGDEKENNLTPASKAIKESFGVWRSTNGGGCLIFAEEGYFYWYKSCSDVSNNYHYGNLMGARGSQALYELGMTYDDAIIATGLDAGKITTEKFYSLILDTTETTNASVKRTTNLSKFKMLFAYVSDSEATMYDVKAGGDVYHLEKISKIQR